MKKVLIGLLIAAVGVGAYYYFSNKKQNIQTSHSTELIAGTWKIDSLVTPHEVDSSQRLLVTWMHPFLDSTLKKYEFEFKKDSLLLSRLDGKIKDTCLYEVADSKNLLIRGSGDSVRTKWSIIRLDSTSLVVNDSDSTLFYFKRIN